MQTALYHPEHGYYRREARRVGRHREADFYTAESIGPVFARLVLAAASSLLGGRLSEYTFVELGAEPGQSPFAALAGERCRGYRAVRQADPLELEGPCVVFGNEVLDAQPFHRLIYAHGQWRECGVAIRDNVLSECLLPELTQAIRDISLPEDMPEGYRLDIALEAESLLRELWQEPWHGLLLQLDYGRSWEELMTARPHGTARAYYRHAVSDALLARPGEQDLTCHVCWDRLEALLAGLGAVSKVQRQESFFVLHAEQEIARIIGAMPDRFDPQRQSLMELLHPQHMGTRFQVLHALKTS